MDCLNGNDFDFWVSCLHFLSTGIKVMPHSTQFYVTLGLKLRALYTLDKHSVN